MPIARLKEKRQITVPVEICRQIHADKGDIFDFEVDDGKVIMRLQRLVPVTAQQPMKQVIDVSLSMGSTEKSFESVDQTRQKMALRAEKTLTFIKGIEHAHVKAKAKGYNVNIPLNEEEYYKQYL
jgi:bifunctional DNA-binding transcriptional regulator/antitoxin component of YhaV-PrlF toxin-antitoxin module